MESINHKIAIIGKGVIGIGFAVLFTGNGIPVTVLAKDAPIGLQRYNDMFALLMKHNLVSEAQAAKCRELLQFTDTYAGIADAEIIFECITEHLPTKHDVYASIEANCSRLSAIVSASSVITPDDLSANMERKDLLLVAHPYNPAYLIPCVEVVPGQHTSSQAMELVCNLLRRVKREVIVMKKNPLPALLPTACSTLCSARPSIWFRRALPILPISTAP